jgi:plasmid stabilization system protein ParE
MVPKGEKTISMLPGAPSAAQHRRGAISDAVATTAATARDGRMRPRFADDSGELLIPVASVKRVSSRAKGISRSKIAGHPVYSSGCPEVVRW